MDLRRQEIEEFLTANVPGAEEMVTPPRRQPRFLRVRVTFELRHQPEDFPEEHKSFGVDVVLDLDEDVPLQAAAALVKIQRIILGEGHKTRADRPGEPPAWFVALADLIQGKSA